MSERLKLLFSAVEPSGDALGAALIRALRARQPEIEIIGCGGEAMAGEGLQSIFDTAPLAVIGPVAAARAIPAALAGAGALAQLAAMERPAAAIFIDSWTFSKMAAKRLRVASPETKRYKFVAPQVWASRPKRTETAARLFDGMLTLFDFETPYFEDAGLKTFAVGHPGFQALSGATESGEAFRTAHGIGDGLLIIAAPGSRAGEIARHAPVFRACLDALRGEHPNLAVAIPVAPGRRAMVEAAFADWDSKPLFIEATEKTAAFRAADAGLVASGTISTELAIAGAPMVVAYRVHPLTAMWARSVITTPHVCLVNIAAGREIIPERLQEDCTAGTLAEALRPLIADGPAARAQRAGFTEALPALGVGGPPAAERAAETLLDWIRA
ncbi:MAG: lipid-A-disaccharide synthase [Pseudomonadota bacterium]